MRVRGWVALAASSALIVVGVAPAAAHDESEAVRGDLQVELRPAVVDVDETVVVDAKLKHTSSGGHDDDAADEAEDDADDAAEEAEEADADDDDDDLDAAAKSGDDAASEDAESDERCEGEAVGPASGSRGRGHGVCEATTTVTFEVDFGDGSAPEAMEIDKVRNNKVEAVAEHVYDSEGDYTVSVTAVDAEGVETTVEAVVTVGPGAARLDGDDRIETALRISRESFPAGGAGAVLLARSDAFADALAAATLSLAEQAPVLLIPSGEVPEAVLEEIDRLLGGAGSVHLLGGEAAITSAVVDQLEAEGHDVTRIAGEDRVATSVAIARFLLEAGAVIDEVVIASAVTFPDALSGAAYAAANGAPILLTAPDALSPAVAELLGELDPGPAVTVVGGTAGVSDDVVTALEALGLIVERLAGDDRYDTAVEVAEQGADEPEVIVVATGDTFPDALAGSAFAGSEDAPLLLVGDDVPASVSAYLAEHGSLVDELVVLGGEGAVSPEVMLEVEDALGL